MRFAIYLPAQASTEHKVPVLYWLSGLTCTDENFMQKAGAQRLASELGIAIVAPDTSPRGGAVPDDPDGAYDLGHGAGFYLNATQAPWAKHYRMYDYVVRELPDVIEAHFPVAEKRAICGHSMGGHGALSIALKNPNRYTSASAFSPIVNPSKSPWGQKAFKAYLGENKQDWLAYDTCELMAIVECGPEILIDQGDSDDFLERELMPERLLNIAKTRHYPLTLRIQEGYDHSYYFIATYMGDHMAHHARALKAD